jgi:molecular chaperone GrpE
MSDEQKDMQGEPAVEQPAHAAEAPADVVADLEARLAQAEAQATEYKDQWLRATADYKNFKRRTEIERSELIRSASGGLLLKLLPIIDDFERAEENVPSDIAESAWWGGTRLIGQKLRTLLESEQVTPIEAVGQPFDPNVHEAVMYEPAEGQDGIVTGELQKGYMLRDRMLRPSMVKVGKDD